MSQTKRRQCGRAKPIIQTAPYAGFPRAVHALKVRRAEQEAEA